MRGVRSGWKGCVCDSVRGKNVKTDTCTSTARHLQIHHSEYGLSGSWYGRIWVRCWTTAVLAHGSTARSVANLDKAGIAITQIVHQREIYRTTSVYIYAVCSEARLILLRSLLDRLVERIYKRLHKAESAVETRVLRTQRIQRLQGIVDQDPNVLLRRLG